MGERTPSSVLDEYLVIQCQLGDSAAFRCLVERWHPRILRHAYRFTQDEEAARDVAQETWLSVVRGLKGLRDPARFPGWVLKIAANKARDCVRREHTRGSAQGRPEVGASQSGVSRESASRPSDVLKRLQAGLDDLAPNQRLLLIREALGEPSDEGVDELKTQSVAELLTETFRGQNRRLAYGGAVVNVVFFGATVLSGIRFLRADDLRVLLFWGFVMLLCFGAVTAIKIWYWMEMNRLAVTREIKRVELHVVQLAKRLSD